MAAIDRSVVIRYGGGGVEQIGDDLWCPGIPRATILRRLCEEIQIGERALGGDWFSYRDIADAAALLSIAIGTDEPDEEEP